ncbi:MAG: tetratricopeptide repeat protein [Candidatus Pseudobacter hemicellulosilyticus]|uniref:Tetratricopeptide repeat protein n=1 Tax=Candidatus Pseudobacter hemicellulosilyticus TaxID=3121375 RepID=A0AAJ5WTQ0_9BACT|nr:MAG: tetratricopeptide repeat protein [Pseudobacter sp.]
MFGLFKRKIPLRPTVDPAQKEWIEDIVSWLLSTVPFQQLKARPFLDQNDELLRFNDPADLIQLNALLANICRQYGLEPDDVTLRVFDDLQSMEWSTPLAPMGAIPGRSTYSTRVYSKESKKYQVELAKSSLGNTELLIRELAFELACIYLVRDGMVKQDNPELAQITELTCIYYGFGIFIANTALHKNEHWVIRSGNLKMEVISYANALLCYIAEADPTAVTVQLNTNTRELFQQDSQYLRETGDTFLTAEEIARQVDTYHGFKAINDAYDAHDLDGALAACKKELDLKPEETSLHNYYGYILLRKKEYGLAVDSFTNSIRIDPYHDYAYNNRGYCRLQLGQVDESFADLDTAWQVNPDNSFSWRNMGLYYLLTQDNPKAIEYLERAYSLDPKTEMIHFYLAMAYRQSGGQEQARHHADLSVSKNEFNDSVFSLD